MANRDKPDDNCHNASLSVYLVGSLFLQQSEMTNGNSSSPIVLPTSPNSLSKNPLAATYFAICLFKSIFCAATMTSRKSRDFA